MPEYINPNTFTVHLAGPDGRAIRVKSRQRITLSDYFDKYRSRGFIKLASEVTQKQVRPNNIQAKINLTRPSRQPRSQSASSQPNLNKSLPSQEQLSQDRKKRRAEIAKARKIISNEQRQKRIQPRITKRPVNQIVGRVVNANPNELLKSNLAKGNYPISNNIGVGILSYNRKESLQRLINSIITHTDLRRTTVFICDDNSINPDVKEYLDQLSQNDNFVVIKNDTRLGIAGNTNRLLKCLSRFEHCLILNDDVEILEDGWEYFYANAMMSTGMHHFIYRQNGVYGATVGEAKNISGLLTRVVYDKPHGAVLAYSHTMFDKCGYFDEEYGLYGMEHVDWSNKAWEFGLQSQGFYDVDGSDKYFFLHSEISAVENRQELLRAAKNKFESRVVKKHDASVNVVVPEISYIIPFRNIERTDSIRTVVNNIRGQKFPCIEIILVEQDSESRINLNEFNPVQYYLARENNKLLFNKSMAFNLAASKAATSKLVLHDADMLVQGNYTSFIYNTLNIHAACHAGNSVIYADAESTNVINSIGLVTDNTKCERIVGYFEGGSLACTVEAYWKCGAFNEDFWGYGCEDCDFYARLAANSTWCENRIFDFLHLWHGRVTGWNVHHDTNRRIEATLAAKSMTERVMLQHSQLRKLGYGGFIKNGS